jgi:hypothetical protein
MKQNFRDIRNSTRFDAIEPPKADPRRVEMVSSGNPNVLSEAKGLEDYARKRRKRGGRVKLDGVRPKHRLDRPSRRKFGDGGYAEGEQPSVSPPSIGSAVLKANPKARAIAAGLAGIQKVDQAISKETGTRPAHHRGGSAR